MRKELIKELQIEQERKPLQRYPSQQNYCGSKSQSSCCVIKKSTGFSGMSVTASLLCFGYFAAGQRVNEGFFVNIGVFFYWLASIIGTYIIDLLSRAQSRLQQKFNVCFPLQKKRHCFRVYSFLIVFAGLRAPQLIAQSSV